MDSKDILFKNIDGEVKVCCRGTKPFGNIFSVPFRDIWYSKEYIEERRGLVSKYAKRCNERLFKHQNTSLGQINLRKFMVMKRFSETRKWNRCQ